MGTRAGILYKSSASFWSTSFSWPKTAKPVLVASHIVATPGTLGGKPRIAGHRISVQDIVIWHERMGLSVDDIAAKYDLAPESVLAALTYYSLNRDEIDNSIRADEAFVAEMRQRSPSTLKARRDG